VRGALIPHRAKKRVALLFLILVLIRDRDVLDDPAEDSAARRRPARILLHCRDVIRKARLVDVSSMRARVAVARAIYALSVVGLLANDHVLKHEVWLPGWVTGKLSDFFDHGGFPDRG
jgi:hypothetical protein